MIETFSNNMDNSEKEKLQRDFESWKHEFRSFAQENRGYMTGGKARYSIEETEAILNNFQLDEKDILLQYRGILDLSFTPMRFLPTPLKVNGDLDISGTRIFVIKNSIEVQGDFNCEFSPIESLPDHLNVAGDLNLSNLGYGRFDESMSKNHAVLQLPKTYLKVGGKINLGSTRIDFFPENVEVGGDLIIATDINPDIESYLNGLKESGKIKGDICFISGRIV